MKNGLFIGMPSRGFNFRHGAAFLLLCDALYYQIFREGKEKMKVKIFNSESFEKDIKECKKEALLENDFMQLTYYNGFEMLIDAYTVETEIPDSVKLPAFPDTDEITGISRRDRK